MTKYAEILEKKRGCAGRNWMTAAEPYSKLALKTFDQVKAELKLSRALKKAVLRDSAPQGLIDSIRDGIRK